MSESPLLRRPATGVGPLHDITPESAGWTYVGFALHQLAEGETASGGEAGREALIVIVQGVAEIEVDGRSFGALGERKSVFEGGKPWCVYAPAGATWRIRGVAGAEVAICTAPGGGTQRAARVIGPDDIPVATRGRGANTRRIHPIAMEEADVADSLLVTEVFTPSGNWSSYPPHRHDEDDFPRMTLLEETYYHRLDPPQGFGVQRVFTEDGTLDETMAVHDRDVVLVPRGHHPCGAPYGYEMYYLNVMAGPMRKWRFQNHPDHDWIAARDA